MARLSSIAALTGALVVGAAGALFIAPQVAPPGLLPGIGGVSTAEAQTTAPAGQDGAAEQPAADPEKGEVIAVVNGENLYEADLSAFIQQLPPQLQAQVQMLMPQILDQLVNNQLSTEAGRAAGLAGDAQVQRRLREIEDLIIGQTYLQREIDERVTDAEIDKAYQAYLEENPPQRQLKARHILVETEEAAKEVIAELDGGADFAALAKEHSTGPSGANGGELPPFTEGEMVPEFSDAAFAMEPGTYSKEPVKTQFGWHVIKLEESTMTEPPAKEEVAGQLRGELEQQAAATVYEDLRKDAEIEILFGKPKDGEAPASGSEAPADGGAGSTTEQPAPPANN